MNRYGLMKLCTLIAAVVVSASLLCSCNAGSTSDKFSGFADEFDDYAAFDEKADVEFSSLNSSLTAERKLIRNASMTLETKDFDKFSADFEQKISEIGGYIESQSENMSANRNYRHADYVARIPAEKLDEFLSAVSDISTVIRKNSGLDDVTDSYIDTESHIAALEAEHESLLALLDRAESLSDIMSIQKRAAEVRAELDSYKARIKSYDNRIAYSSVSVSVSEVERTSAVDKGFFETVAEDISGNFGIVVDGLRSLAIFLLGSIPFIIVIAVVAVIVIVIVKASVKSYRRNRDKSDGNSAKSE